MVDLPEKITKHCTGQMFLVSIKVHDQQSYVIMFDGETVCGKMYFLISLLKRLRNILYRNIKDLQECSSTD